MTPQVCNCVALTDAKVSPPEGATGMRLTPVAVAGSPSWPVKLSPQQYAVFIVGALAIPQEWPAPVRTVAKVSPPPTPSGVVLPVVVPSPSWPLLLSPQQYAAPTVVMPQVFRNPALTAAKVSPPETAAGVELLVVVPLPSWP